jgi:hypothetical protein
MVWVKPLSPVTSVLVAILATGLKAFKFEENCFNYRTKCETPKKEIHFFNVGVDEYDFGLKEINRMAALTWNQAR